jgi:hypothetical protein
VYGAILERPSQQSGESAKASRCIGTQMFSIFAPVLKQKDARQGHAIKEESSISL